LLERIWRGLDEAARKVEAEGHKTRSARKARESREAREKDFIELNQQLFSCLGGLDQFVVVVPV